jgi:hypothetical protein
MLFSMEKKQNLPKLKIFKSELNTKKVYLIIKFNNNNKKRYI